ncbi:hypothetical protein L0337_23360 [candidate division KSB1 bacterium]|nr:hypothetical protein [candidate division KSB1 bacterium]
MSQDTSAKPDSTAKPYPETESSSEQVGKIAEGVATYAVRATPKSRTPARTIVGLVADDEVWAFIKANNLLPSLETAIGLAQKAFPGLSGMTLSYEADPEIPQFASVAIKIQAAGKIDDLVEQNKNYVRSFIQSVPAKHHHQIDLLLVGVA